MNHSIYFVTFHLNKDRFCYYERLGTYIDRVIKDNKFCKMLSGVKKIEKIGLCNIPYSIHLQVCEKCLGLCHMKQFLFMRVTKKIGEFSNNIMILDTKG